MVGCSLVVVVGCGDDAATSASAASTTSVSGVDPTSGGSGGASVPTTTDGGEGTASGGGTTASTTVGTLDTSATGPATDAGTTVVTATTSGSATSGTTVGLDDSGTGGSSSGEPAMDLPSEGCDVKCGNTDWSYVWIANSGENTLSKLDTRNMTEEGRYFTRPDQQGSPSRTSVSIDGKAVAVANRSGGITKVWAREEYCSDKNGNGVIDTSSGKNDVLAFDVEECIAWYTPFAGATTQRPIAWTSGVYNTDNCEYEEQKIWTAASYGNGDACNGADGVHVYRLNGDTGEVEDTVHLPDVPCGLLGAYGAAVDADNNAWFFVFGGGLIFRVDHETLAHEVVYKGFYGITVDTKSRVWLDDGSRYDPVTKQWALQIGDLQPNGGSGVAQDLKGRIWHATNGGIGWLDAETMVVGGKVILPNQGLARGIGVDVDGYIWAVILGGTVAYRIHPDTFEIASYDGLNMPYTYSDMAGGQINNVICPQ